MWLGVACERHLGDLLNEAASRRHIEPIGVGKWRRGVSVVGLHWTRHLGTFAGVKVTYLSSCGKLP